MEENSKWALEYLGLSDINGPLVAVDGLRDGGAGYEEMVEVKTETETRLGRVVALEGSRAVVQVFAGTAGLGLSGVRTRFTGQPMRGPHLQRRGPAHRRPGPGVRQPL